MVNDLMKIVVKVSRREEAVYCFETGLVHFQ